MKLSGETGPSGFAGFGYAVSGYREGSAKKKQKKRPKLPGVVSVQGFGLRESDSQKRVTYGYNYVEFGQ